jgi:coenzyme F420-0:L-glutamate ligase / coenzyme F420-1:gamma-L-glutamate ligase
MAPATIKYAPLGGVPEVAAGDDLAALALEALAREGEALRAGDVLVFAQKVVSKAEGRQRSLAGIEPSPQARALAAQSGKDPRLVELVLAESSAVLRVAPNVIIVRHRCGYVMANAGIDRSNTGAGEDVVLLLPEDSDVSARRLRERLAQRTGVAPGVVVSDSFGRAWRLGTVNVALGAAGVPALVDRRGEVDREGRRLQITQVAVADAIAAGAGLAMGEATEGTPIVLVRGFASDAPCGPASALLRPEHEDLFL